MPVDNNEIQNMIQLAIDKLSSLDSERSKLNIFRVNCTEILEVPNPDDKTKVLDITDRALGIKMKTQRRQDIYDKLLTEKTTLGL